MSGRDDESCDIMRHHVTSCDREWKGVGSGWRKMSFDRRRCGRETRWQERERKAGGHQKRKRKTGGRRKRKGFPLQYPKYSACCYGIYREARGVYGKRTINASVYPCHVYVSSIFDSWLFIHSMISPVINPQIKLQWAETHWSSSEYVTAKKWIEAVVCDFSCN